MSTRYWQNFLLAGSGLVILLYLGKKLTTPAPPKPPVQ